MSSIKDWFTGSVIQHTLAGMMPAEAPIMGYAKVPITQDLLLEALHFPSGTSLLGIEMKNEFDDPVLLVSHDNLKMPFSDEPDTAPDTPMTTPLFRKNVPIEFLSWGAQDIRGDHFTHPDDRRCSCGVLNCPKTKTYGPA